MVALPKTTASYVVKPTSEEFLDTNFLDKIKNLMSSSPTSGSLGLASLKRCEYKSTATPKRSLYCTHVTDILVSAHKWHESFISYISKNAEEKGML